MIIPLSNRREAYFSLENSLHLKLPRLVLNNFWDNILMGLGLVTILGSLVGGWILLLPVIGAVATWGLSELLEPRRVMIEQSKVRDFIQQTLALNLSTLMISEGTNWTEMEQINNNIIAYKFGLDILVITAEKKIVDELGID